MGLIIYSAFLADRLIYTCIGAMFILVVVLIVYVAISAIDETKLNVKLITRLFIGVIVFALLSLFVPSTKQIESMYFLSKVMENQDNDDTSTKVHENFGKYMDDIINGRK